MSPTAVTKVPATAKPKPIKKLCDKACRFGNTITATPTMPNTPPTYTRGLIGVLNTRPISNGVTITLSEKISVTIAALLYMVA